MSEIINSTALKTGIITTLHTESRTETYVVSNTHTLKERGRKAMEGGRQRKKEGERDPFIEEASYILRV